MPKVSNEKRQASILADADSVAYTGLSLRRALENGDHEAAAEAAKQLEAIGCRARRFVKSLES